MNSSILRVWNKRTLKKDPTKDYVGNITLQFCVPHLGTWHQDASSRELWQPRPMSHPAVYICVASLLG